MNQPKNICIIGMGYVGLTMAIVLAKKGFNVYGIEMRKEVVDGINNLKPHFYEEGLVAMLKKHLNENLFILEKIPANKKIDAFVITVGTPLNKDTKKPNVEYIQQAVKDIAENLRENGLVILRSTVPVGLTRKVVLPILKKYSKAKKFYLAFCPERTIEGKALKELEYLPQIISGLDKKSLELAVSIFERVTPTIVKTSSLEAGEMTKLLDNSYRDMTFAYSNEIALIAKAVGLDAFEIIKAANFDYPRNHIAVPGFVGGACLEKDPHIMVDFAQRAGYFPKLIRTGRDINEYLPVGVAEKIKDLFENVKKDIKTAKIFITGLAFKGQPETDDLRGSLTLNLLDQLKFYGAQNIFGHDFVVKKEEIGKLGITPCSLEDGFRGADCALVMNNHKSYFDLNVKPMVKAMNSPAIFFDGWHIFNPSEILKQKGLIYEGVGCSSFKNN